DYMPDVHTRLVHYKRIAKAASRDALDQHQVELIDRFGLLAPPTKTLFEVTWLKLLAQRPGAARPEAGRGGGTLRVQQRANVDPTAHMRMVEDLPMSYELDGPFKLKFTGQLASDQARIRGAERLVLELGAGELDSAA